MTRTLIASALILMGLTACGGGNKAEQTTASTTTTASGNPSQEVSNTPLPAATQALKIYNWSDYVDPETVKAFEQQHGLKVVYDVYDSNETLEAKVLTGQSGYDLVAPSNTYVGRQIASDAYQKLNKAWLPQYDQIEPRLLTFLDSVDPGNEYAVPYFWGMNTLGINKDKVQAILGEKLPDNEWELLFNPVYTNKLKSCGISILDSVSDVFPLALNYLGKDPLSQDVADLKAAADLVKTIRPDIRRFSSSGYIDDLARGDLCMTLGYGGDLNIAQRRAKEAGNQVNIEVLVPKTGFGVWIDVFVIPKDAVNVAHAYQYINNTLVPEVAAKNGDFVTYAPASKGAKALMQKEYTENRSVFPSDEDLKNGFMYVPMKPDSLKAAIRMWQDIKSQKG